MRPLHQIWQDELSARDRVLEIHSELRAAKKQILFNETGFKVGQTVRIPYADGRPAKAKIVDVVGLGPIIEVVLRYGAANERVVNLSELKSYIYEHRDINRKHWQKPRGTDV